MDKKIWQDVQDSIKKAAAETQLSDLGGKVRTGIKNAVIKSVSPSGDGSALQQLANSALSGAKNAVSKATSPEAKKTAQAALIGSLKTVQSLCAAGVEKLETSRAAEGTPSDGAPAGESVEAPRAESVGAPAAQNAAPSAPRRERFSGRTRTFRAARKTPDEPEIIRSPSASYRTGRRGFPFFKIALGAALIGAFASGAYLLYDKTLKNAGGNAPAPAALNAPIALNPEAAQPAAPISEEPAPAAEEAVPTVRRALLTRDGVNLRDGHSTRGTRVLARLNRQEMTVLERWEGRDVWYRVETSAGTGWVSGLYVTEAADAREIPAAPAADSGPSRPGFLKGTSVNVRDGHSTRGTRVLTRFSNRDVEILDTWRGGDAFPWYKIRLENGEGWVYGQYIELR